MKKNEALSLAVAVAVLVLQALPAEALEPDGAAGLALQGTIVSDSSGDPVAAARVQLVELSIETSTDETGAFEIANLPRGRFTLGVHAEGYAGRHVPVAVPAEGPLHIRLAADHHFEEEVTVTATAWTTSPLETAQTVAQVDSVAIREQGAASIGEALRSIPGVTTVGTGDALGTPVVRGMSENRIRILNDGVPLNHQQFSSRHSPAVDPLLADRIEVVKGPASVLWGPQAMGGVINLVRAPLPAAGAGETIFHGQVAGGHRSSAGEWNGRIEAEGASGGFGWRLAGVRRSAGDIETPDGALDGTDYGQASGELTLGYTAAWGRLRLRTTHWENDVGFYRPEGFRLELEDESVVADGLFPIATGELTLLLSTQTNSRQALPAGLGGRPAVDLVLVTDLVRAGFSHRQRGAWRGKLALESSRIANEARALGTLVPDYDSENHALMAFEEGRFLPARSGAHDRLHVSLGLRWDSTDLAVAEEASRNLPDTFSQTYSAVTGSLGLVYRLTPTLSLAGSVGRGWRPPSVFELFANGVHGGISAIQLGNSNLREETNLNTEISGRWQSGHLQAAVTGFRNSFDGYIYLAATGEVDLEGGLPVLGYRQADAVLEGVEASLEAVPLEPLRIGLGYARLSTENASTARSLPQTPPDRLRGFIRHGRPALGLLMSPFVELEAVWTGRGEISGPDEPFGTPTDAYTLLHLKTGFRLLAGGRVVGFDLAVNNLLDRAYTDFLWPYKGFGALNPGRDTRLTASYSF